MCPGCSQGCPPSSTCLDEEMPEHRATLSAFRLDKYELSVGRFRKFLSAFDEWRASGNPSVGAGAHPVAGGGWEAAWPLVESTSEVVPALDCGANPTWTASIGPNETLPMNCISWYLAFAFCVWDGGRLPTEAEWEYAAAGGEENRLHPWGSELPNTAYAVYGCLASGGSTCEFSDILSVGSKPLGQGRYGQRDLSGSLYEWVLDWNAPYTSAACTDCANLTPAANRIVKGGRWDGNALGLRGASRGDLVPDGAEPNVGVRCARIP